MMYLAKGTQAVLFIILMQHEQATGFQLFSSRESNCTHSGDVFNCSGAGISTLPELPRGTKVLDLSGNHIQNISMPQTNPDSYKGLLFLDLSKNNIALLKENDFQFLNNLQTLDLSGNQIQGVSLEPEVFNGLDKLKNLTLEGNPLGSVKIRTFHFMQLFSLTYLDLSHCGISSLEKESIMIPTLEHLDLSWNKLTTFSDVMLDMVTSLVLLDMSHNSLKVIDDIPYLPRLRTWILDSNGMEEVHIKEDLQYRADGLENLYLRSNEISKFEREDLPLEMESIKVLDLSDNKLLCDCKMKWIAEQTLETEDKKITIKCKYPPEVEDRNLLDMDATELTCNYPLAKVLFIVAVSCTGVLVFGMGLYLYIRRRRLRKRLRRAEKGDLRGNFTAVYTRDDDVHVFMSDSKGLLERQKEEDREFDV